MLAALFWSGIALLFVVAPAAYLAYKYGHIPLVGAVAFLLLLGAAALAVVAWHAPLAMAGIIAAYYVIGSLIFGRIEVPHD